MKALLDLFITPLAAGFFAILGALPKAAAISVSRTAISLLRVVVPKLDRTAQRNLELIFPEKSLEERKAILDQSFETLARHLYYFGAVAHFPRERFAEIFDYSEGDAVLKTMREKNHSGGALLLTLHFGCFELLGHAQSILDRPMAVVARDLGFPRLDAWLKRRREQFGNRIISRTGAYKEVIQNLTQGHNVCLLFDQNIKANHAAFVSLFGIPAATTKTPAIAALRTGAPVVVSASVEYEPGKFKVLARTIDVPTEGSSEDRVVELLERCHRAVEEFIQLYPAQWYWIHRRFKTRPPGEREDLYLSSRTPVRVRNV